MLKKDTMIRMVSEGNKQRTKVQSEITRKQI